jgi:MFS family permease
MSPAPGTSKSTIQERQPAHSRFSRLSFLHLPRNVYLLLLFTTGKGFQLSIAALTLNLYVHSLGYRPDFVGIFSAMPALGAMIGALPMGILADRLGRKPVLIVSAFLTPLLLALVGGVTLAPLLIFLSFAQGLVSTAYWVTNLPLLVENTTPQQRVGVLAVNSFLLLGIGALGNLLGGATPEFVAHLLHMSANDVIPLRWAIFLAASFTFVFGLPLWFLQEQKSTPQQLVKTSQESTSHEISEATRADTTTREQSRIQDKRKVPVLLFTQLLIPDLLFTMGEGAVVALMQLFFVLRFNLLPGILGIIFTVSGLVGGIFSLTAPLFVKRWSKLRIVTIVQYITAPLMVLIGFAPSLPLAIAGEYTRSFLRTLIEPMYAAFVMEKVSDRHRATLSGLYSVTWSIGFSAGPAIAGWLQNSVSLSASFLFGACCLVLCPTLLLFFFGKRNRE